MPHENGKALEGPSNSVDSDFARSVGYRAARQLYEEGKPTGEIILLYYETPSGLRLTLGAMSLTRNRRLIFWPVLPPDAKCAANNEAHEWEIAPDHLTLELANKKTHFTATTGPDGRRHIRRPWRLTRVGPSDLESWFVLAARRSLLEQEPKTGEVRIPRDHPDAARRVEEFRRLASQFKSEAVKSPDVQEANQYFLSYFFIKFGGSRDVGLKGSDLCVGPFLDEWIDGWPNEDQTDFSTTFIDIDAEIHLLIATACPPGALKRDIVVGSFRLSGYGKTRPNCGPDLANVTRR